VKKHQNQDLFVAYVSDIKGKTKEKFKTSCRTTGSVSRRDEQKALSITLGKTRHNS